MVGCLTGGCLKEAGASSSGMMPVRQTRYFGTAGPQASELHRNCPCRITNHSVRAAIQMMALAHLSRGLIISVPSGAELVTGGGAL
jgi:hypothetical protein